MNVSIKINIMDYIVEFTNEILYYSIKVNM